jgi:hypothetical protein
VFALRSIHIHNKSQLGITGNCKDHTKQTHWVGKDSVVKEGGT